MEEEKADCNENPVIINSEVFMKVENRGIFNIFHEFKTASLPNPRKRNSNDLKRISIKMYKSIPEKANRKIILDFLLPQNNYQFSQIDDLVQFLKESYNIHYSIEEITIDKKCETLSFSCLDKYPNFIPVPNLLEFLTEKADPESLKLKSIISHVINEHVYNSIINYSTKSVNDKKIEKLFAARKERMMLNLKDKNYIAMLYKKSATLTYSVHQYIMTHSLIKILFGSLELGKRHIIENGYLPFLHNPKSYFSKLGQEISAFMTKNQTNFDAIIVTQDNYCFNANVNVHRINKTSVEIEEFWVFLHLSFPSKIMADLGRRRKEKRPDRVIFINGSYI